MEENYEIKRLLEMGLDVSQEDHELVSLNFDGLQVANKKPIGDSSDDEEDDEVVSESKDQVVGAKADSDEEYGDRGNWHNDGDNEDVSEEGEYSEYEEGEYSDSDGGEHDPENEIPKSSDVDAKPIQKSETWKVDMAEADAEYDSPDDAHEEFGDNGSVVLKKDATPDTIAEIEYKTLDKAGNLAKKKGSANSRGLSEAEMDKNFKRLGRTYGRRIQNIRLEHYKDTKVTNSTRDEQIPPRELIWADQKTLDLGKTCRLAYVVGEPGDFFSDEEKNLQEIKKKVPKSYSYVDTKKGTLRYRPDGEVYLNTVTNEYEIKVKQLKKKTKSGQ